MAPVAIVTDTTHYLPRGRRGGERHPPGQPLRPLAGPRRPRGRPARLRRVLRAPAHGARPADDVAAVGRRLPRRLRAAARRRARHRLHPPLGAGSRAPTTRRSPPRPSLDEQGRDGRIEVIDSATACGGLGLVALAAAAGGARGRGRRGRRPPGPGGARAAEHVVLHRHAGVPAPRRAHRRGQRVARHDAEDQADPQGRGPRSRPSSACAPPGARSSGWSTTCAAATTTAPTPGSSSTSRRPTQAERLAERGREIFGTEPLFVSEIGPGDRHPRRARAARRAAGSLRRSCADRRQTSRKSAAPVFDAPARGTGRVGMGMETRARQSERVGHGRRTRGRARPRPPSGPTCGARRSSPGAMTRGTGALVAAAEEQPADGGDPAADDEPGDGRAGQRGCRGGGAGARASR